MQNPRSTRPQTNCGAHGPTCLLETPVSWRAAIIGAAVCMGGTFLPTNAHAQSVTDLSALKTFDDFVAFAQEHEMPCPPSHDYAAATERSAAAARGSHRWELSGGAKSFYDGCGNRFLSPAIKVIDVSFYQGTIDWSAVKQSGVDAAIIRCGFGIGYTDKQFYRNVSECSRLGIPFGIYLYSYAYDAAFAAKEGEWTAELVKRSGVKPDLPIFYDMEQWNTWEGHTPPTSPSVNKRIVDAFFSALSFAGFNNTAVYSYTSYLNGPLNHDSIHARTKWVAQYGPLLEFDVARHSPSFYGWQYSSTESVSGIQGNVDMSAFTPQTLYGFNDVTYATDHHEDIGWMKENGIATGFPNGSFGGMQTAKRQDVAAFLYRTAGRPSFSPSASEISQFSDVSWSTDHCNAIWWLASTNVAEGFVDGTFGGMLSIKRQDMAAFLYRMAGSPSFTPTHVQMNRFRDVDTSTSHCNEIWWLASTGITTGFSDGTFRGLNDVTRQDIAAFLHRLYEYVGGSFNL